MESGPGILATANYLITAPIFQESSKNLLGNTSRSANEGRKRIIKKIKIKNKKIKVKISAYAS